MLINMSTDATGKFKFSGTWDGVLGGKLLDVSKALLFF
jgi:hypothetical protein